MLLTRHRNEPYAHMHTYTRIYIHIPLLYKHDRCIGAVKLSRLPNSKPIDRRAIKYYRGKDKSEEKRKKGKCMETKRFEQRFPRSYTAPGICTNTN